MELAFSSIPETTDSKIMYPPALPPPPTSPIPFLRGPHRKTAFVLSCKQNPFKGQNPFST